MVPAVSRRPRLIPPRPIGESLAATAAIIEARLGVDTPRALLISSALSGEGTTRIRPNTEDMVMDWLAAGLDPERNILFIQSQVPEVLTLHTLLSMTTPLGWLLRVPSFKEKVRQMGEDEEHVPYGLVGRLRDRCHHGASRSTQQRAQ